MTEIAPYYAPEISYTGHNMQTPKQPELAWVFALGVQYGKRKKDKESYHSDSAGRLINLHRL